MKRTPMTPKQRVAIIDLLKRACILMPLGTSKRAAWLGEAETLIHEIKKGIE